MFRIIYYQRKNGREPAREWIRAQDGSIRPDINARIADLSENGLGLLGTKSLSIIEGDDNGFYELRNRTLNWRLGIYHDLKRDAFVLLHGWRHTKKLQSEILKAREFLHDYLRTTEKNND